MAEQKEETGHCSCPYCDVEIMEALSPYCQSCNVTIFYCPECQKPLSREDQLCSHCGAEIKGVD
ncbi:zinc ribbon domain-containing protein [Chloroflexota bacterium]